MFWLQFAARITETDPDPIESPFAPGDRLVWETLPDGRVWARVIHAA